jgi:hypothetical protein
MKFINSYGVEAVEIRLPHGKVIPASSSASCRGIIEGICLAYVEYDMSISYLINEKGIVYENCTLGECEGDLSLVCPKLKSKITLLSLSCFLNFC